MRIAKAISFFSLVLLFQPTLLAQPYYFRHYQVENGLSNNSITCSLQDRMGFLWFGTKDGLNRFDGYFFKVFKKIEGNSKSIGNNFIHCLYEDKQGVLWIGTEQGLYAYSQTTEEFRLVPATAKMFIDKIGEDLAGNIWLISYYQLWKFENKSKKMVHYDSNTFFTACTFGITKEGTVWIGTPEGKLKRYHAETDSFLELDVFSHNKLASERWIESINPTTDGSLVVGTTKAEIKIVDPVHATYVNKTIFNDKPTSLYIKHFLQTVEDEWWLGTESGVFIYNRKTEKVQQIKKQFNNAYSITDNSITAMCRDREGGVWIGTLYGGINYYPNQSVFTKYFPQKGENSLSGNVVGEIKEDNEGNLWIGTKDAGLNKLDRINGKFSHFKPDGKKGDISYLEIHGLLVTGNELWIGTYQHGLDVMSIATGKVIRHYEAGISGFTHNYIYCIYKTKAEQILLGTALGVFNYNRVKNKFEAVPGLRSDIWYTAILQDAKGRLWGATFGYGLQVYNPTTGIKESFVYNEKDVNSLSSNRVTSLFEDSQRNLWVATESGICKWNEQTHTFTRYGTANGFPSDFVLSMLEDTQQHLWISTTKGLVRFQEASGKIDVFTTANGLISDQFNYNSAYKDLNGRMYFGSAKGLISFDPEKFTSSSFTPPVYLTGFLVNGKEVMIDSDGSPLKKSISYTDKMILTHRQSTFSFDFAAVNFSAPEGVQYSYLMEGLVNKWVNLKTNRHVDFIGLASGTYTFRVKAFANGRWSKETAVSIVISPPWWASPSAYAIYILVALSSIFLLVRYYHNRMEKRNKRKIELLQMANEKETLEKELAQEKELLQAKIDFFTNVAHEIKTPLTIIKVPLDKIIRKSNGNLEIENSLKIMDRNTNRLIELTNQLLDFRQVEINNFNIRLEHAEISKLVAEAGAGFITLAEQNGIHMDVQLPGKPLYAYVDNDAFNKIIYNLFSNAVKYATTKVHVVLYTQPIGSNFFTILVKSDGNLIPDDQKEKIFEPFYRIHSSDSQTGTGIGLTLALSLTLLHNGTLSIHSSDGMNVFSLTLPINISTENALSEKDFRLTKTNDQS